MRLANGMIAAACVLFVVTAHVQGQAGPGPDAAPAGGRQGGRGAGGAAGAGAGGAPAAGQGGRGGATFPAQQRPPGDPAVIARGKVLYGIHCTSCHGADLRGGDIGGPNLLRSPIALNDQNGELIGPIVREGKSTPGVSAMPALGIAPEDITAIAVYIHSVAATMRGQGSPPALATAPVLNVLVGTAARGQTYFATKCASCHSATGDLGGIGTRVPDPVQLQNRWVSGRAGGGGRGGGAPDAGAAPATVVTAIVTMANGQRAEGRLVRVDDFIVTLVDAEGLQRSFRRGPDTRVEIRDPLEAHRKLLPTYTDADIHDVTAYLVTLK